MDKQLHIQFPENNKPPFNMEVNLNKKFEFEDLTYGVTPGKIINQVFKYIDFKQGVEKDTRLKKQIFEEGLNKAIAKYRHEIASIDSTPNIIKRHAWDIFIKS